MIGAEIIGTVLAAAAQRAVVKLSTQGIDGLVGWLSREVRDQFEGFSYQDEKRLRSLLAGDQTRLGRLAAQFKFTDRRGVLFVGPSGAGKTALVDGLKGRGLTPIPRSTPDIRRFFLTIARRHIALRDTPGAAVQGHGSA